MLEYLTSGIGEADQPVAHLEPDPGAEHPGQLARDQAEIAHSGGERDVGAGALHEQPGDDAERDQGHRDEGRTLRLVFVVIRDHNPIVVVNRRSVARASSRVRTSVPSRAPASCRRSRMATASV